MTASWIAGERNRSETSMETRARLTTNLDYPEWQNFLYNPGLVEALLSRLQHRCKTVLLNGVSLRDPQG
jgi:DNA replication protein DnaC